MTGFFGGGIFGRSGGNNFALTRYTGNGTTQSIITGQKLLDGAMVLLSKRDESDNRNIIDTVRGATIGWRTDAPLQEYTEANGLTAFLSTGFSLGNSTNVNDSGKATQAFSWLKKKGYLDIVSYTGTGAARTIGHALEVAPSVILAKARGIAASGTDYGIFYHSATGTQYGYSGTSDALATDATYWNAAPDASNFSVGTNLRVNKSGVNYIAYLFAEKTGISKFGSYVGNSSSAGAVIACGFRPKAWLVKNASSAGNWRLAWVEGANIYSINLNDSLPIKDETANWLVSASALQVTGVSSEINGSGDNYIYAIWG